ncbi:MAG: hypothetical protein JXQ68_04475 [Campylobacterales bacterium]|nr:hypothetical protein [Campylobacterales bacterium]
MARYTQKQIDKYNRQKYISLLEKIAKNLFRMFRDTDVSYDSFLLKFESMASRLSEYENILLDGEYYSSLKGYIESLFMKLKADDFDALAFEEMREMELTNLNRLQKLKNKTNYKKEKHRAKYDDYN